MSNKWTVQVERESETGELLLPLPVDMLNQMGWASGTDLWWIDNNDGSYTVTDKNPDAETPVATVDIDTDVGC